MQVRCARFHRVLHGPIEHPIFLPQGMEALFVNPVEAQFLTAARRGSAISFLVVTPDYAYFAMPKSFTALGRVEDAFLLAGIPAEGSRMDGLALATLAAHALCGPGRSAMAECDWESNWNSSTPSWEGECASWGELTLDDAARQEFTSEALLAKNTGDVPVGQLAQTAQEGAYLALTISTKDGEYCRALHDLQLIVGSAWHAIARGQARRVVIAIAKAGALSYVPGTYHGGRSHYDEDGTVPSFSWIHHTLTLLRQGVDRLLCVLPGPEGVGHTSPGARLWVEQEGSRLEVHMASWYASLRTLRTARIRAREAEQREQQAAALRREQAAWDALPWYERWKRQWYGFRRPG